MQRSTQWRGAVARFLRDQDGWGRCESLSSLFVIGGLGIAGGVALFGAATGPVNQFIQFNPFSVTW